MLSNCEKMVVISPTTNEWPQSSQVDEKTLMASANTQQNHQDLSQIQQQQQQQQQQPQQALRCPRCDSSNTKFCYYNNYSLSQPRHFCKACKRYWTRGGTLRNVPVGGGCRKNKRVKRPSGSMDGSNTSTPGASPNPSSQPQIDISSSSNHLNPLFYGLPGSAPELNHPFSSRFNSSGYDLPPHLNALGLGFSSNPLLSTYSGIFGSSSATTAATPTIASLLASTIKNNASYQALGPFDDLQMGNNGGEMALNAAMKDVKMENGHGRMEWQNQMDQHVGLSDPTVYWNTNGVGGAWHDQGNIGSSVTSLSSLI